MIDPIYLTVIENELKRLQIGVTETWKIYMAWYTWFFGANLIVLGWIFTQPITSSAVRDPKSVAMLAISWIFFNGLGIANSLRVRKYTMDVSQQTQKLSRSITESSPVDLELDSNLGFPNNLGSFGALANAASLFVNTCLWLYLLIHVLLKQ